MYIVNTVWQGHLQCYKGVSLFGFMGCIFCKVIISDFHGRKDLTWPIRLSSSPLPSLPPSSLTWIPTRSSRQKCSTGTSMTRSPGTNVTWLPAARTAETPTPISAVSLTSSNSSSTSGSTRRHASDTLRILAFGLGSSLFFFLLRFFD